MACGPKARSSPYGPNTRPRSIPRPDRSVRRRDGAAAGLHKQGVRARVVRKLSRSRNGALTALVGLATAMVRAHENRVSAQIAEAGTRSIGLNQFGGSTGASHPGDPPIGRRRSPRSACHRSVHYQFRCGSVRNDSAQGTRRSRAGGAHRQTVVCGEVPALATRRHEWDSSLMWEEANAPRWPRRLRRSSSRCERAPAFSDSHSIPAIGPWPAHLRGTRSSPNRARLVPNARIPRPTRAHSHARRVPARKPSSAVVHHRYPGPGSLSAPFSITRQGGLWSPRDLRRFRLVHRGELAESLVNQAL